MGRIVKSGLHKVVKTQGPLLFDPGGQPLRQRGGHSALILFNFCLRGEIDDLPWRNKLQKDERALYPPVVPIANVGDEPIPQGGGILGCL